MVNTMARRTDGGVRFRPVGSRRSRTAPVYGGRTILDPQGSASRAQVAMILRSYAEHVVNA